MRKFLTVLLLLPFVLYGQYRIPYKSMSLLFIAGSCDGISETLKFHYQDFKDKFPRSKDTYWDPDISYKNKWKDGVSGKEKFLGSSTVFVWTTDGYHLSRTISKAFICGAVVVNIGEKKKFMYYVYDFALYSASYSIGFSLVFDKYFR